MMDEPKRRANKRLEKALEAEFRQCIRKERTHLRVGVRRNDGTSVAFVGMASDLHGTVCTCCERQEES